MPQQDNLHRLPPAALRAQQGYRCCALCSSVIGVNLCCARPLYKNPVTAVRQGKRSTRRRQGRLRVEGAEKAGVQSLIGTWQSSYPGVESLYTTMDDYGGNEKCHAILVCCKLARVLH
jgi:hypothetical protein